MKTLASIFVVLLVTVLPMVVTAAEPYETSFTPQNVTSIIDDSAVMVVAANPDAKIAASRLAGVLRQTPGVTLVMDGASLGDVSSKSDEDIFKAAAVYPIQSVVVVRVFPAADGQTVAVIAYSKKGGDVRRTASVMSNAVLQAATVTSQATTPTKQVPATKPLDPNLPKALASRVELKASAVSAVKADELKRGKFNRQYVHFGPEDWESYRGVFNEPIAGADFYNAIREPALADAYDSANAWRVGLLVGGGTASALGAGLLFVGLPNDTDTTMVATGASLLGLGVGALIWGLVMDPQPISEAEARQRAESFNNQLRSEIGAQ